MCPDPLSSDIEIPEENPNKELYQLIDEYENLLEIQTVERKKFLDRIGEIIDNSEEIESLDVNLQQFTRLLIDIKEQLRALSKTSIPSITRNVGKKVVSIASKEDIDTFAELIENKSTQLDDEIKSLSQLLENKKDEVKEKDVYIEKLNDKLDMLADEKTRLIHELENLNSMIESWESQLNILQKLTSSDPRYKIIDTLKKHGELSDIQLAFTMGTSINKLRKYIQDLINLELVGEDENNRYYWTGKEIDEHIGS